MFVCLCIGNKSFTKNVIMKKILLLTCLLNSIVVTQIFAQDSVKVVTKSSFHIVELGLRFMPTFSAFDMKTSSGGTMTGEVTLGYGVAGVLGINFTEHVGVQGELIYNSLSQKFKDQALEHEINVSYINIPIMLSLNTGKSKVVNLNFVVGPQFGMSLGSSVKSSGGGATDTLKTVWAAKQNDVGLAYGIGVGIILNQAKTLRFDLGYRGIYGFMNISEANPALTNNSVFILDRANVRTNSAYIGLSLLF